MSFSFYTTRSTTVVANNRGLVMEPLVASIAQRVEIRALSMAVDSQINPGKWHGGWTEVYIVELWGKQ